VAKQPLWAGFAGGIMVEAPRLPYDVRPRGWHVGPIDWHPVKIQRGFVDKVGPVVATTLAGKAS